MQIQEVEKHTVNAEKSLADAQKRIISLEKKLTLEERVNVTDSEINSYKLLIANSNAEIESLLQQVKDQAVYEELLRKKYKQAKKLEGDMQEEITSLKLEISQLKNIPKKKDDTENRIRDIFQTFS